MTPAGPVLTASQIAARWGLAVSTVHVMWRNNQMPAPFNPQATRGFRWSERVIEEFESTGSAA